MNRPAYNSLSKYLKLTAVLLIDAIPVWATVNATTADDVDSDFLGLGLVMMFLFFFIFNAWALIIYFLTQPIERLWLRDILFYLLILFYLFSPLLLLALFG